MQIDLPEIRKRKQHARRDLVIKDTSEDGHYAYMQCIDYEYLRGLQILWEAHVERREVNGATLLAPIVTTYHSFVDSHINSTLASKISQAGHSKEVGAESVEFFKNLRSLTLSSAKSADVNKLRIMNDYMVRNDLGRIDSALIDDVELVCDLRDILHHFEGDFRLPSEFTNTVDRVLLRVGIHASRNEAVRLSAATPHILVFVRKSFCDLLLALSPHFANAESIEKQHARWLENNLSTCLTPAFGSQRIKLKQSIHDSHSR